MEVCRDHMVVLGQEERKRQRESKRERKRDPLGLRGIRGPQNRQLWEPKGDDGHGRIYLSHTL